MRFGKDMIKNDGAVSPVIGVILMVAITVILAAVIAAFVFGMGAPEVAPQASVKGSVSTQNSQNVILIEHQGGDAVILDSAHTRVSISGNSTTEGPITLNTTMSTDDSRFEAGEQLYLFYSTSPELDTSTIAGSDAANPVGVSGETITVKIIDVASQQMIADFDVRF